ncbi:nitroreductase family protein [Lactobacillus jensenii]|uniref:nitroreductase family protein n=1 Tax=Lactobacillus jensenii TaxID=109790 RepID=UPI00358DCD15
MYDLGAFAQTLMLAATDMGLGSMVAYEFVKYPDEIRQILPIPEKEAIAVGIAVGYEAEDHINNFRSERLSLDNVLQIFD